MARRAISFETRDEFFELVCAGMPLSVAAQLVGVSEDTGQRWWRQSGVMTLPAQAGARGGLSPAMSMGPR